MEIEQCRQALLSWQYTTNSQMMTNLQTRSFLPIFGASRGTFLVMHRVSRHPSPPSQNLVALPMGLDVAQASFFAHPKHWLETGCSRLQKPQTILQWAGGGA
jgi:hypothetical protein